MKLDFKTKTMIFSKINFDTKQILKTLPSMSMKEIWPVTNPPKKWFYFVAVDSCKSNDFEFFQTQKLNLSNLVCKESKCSVTFFFWLAEETNMIRMKNDSHYLKTPKKKKKV